MVDQLPTVVNQLLVPTWSTLHGASLSPRITLDGICLLNIPYTNPYKIKDVKV